MQWPRIKDCKPTKEEVEAREKQEKYAKLTTDLRLWLGIYAKIPSRELNDRFACMVRDNIEDLRNQLYKTERKNREAKLPEWAKDLPCGRFMKPHEFRLFDGEWIIPARLTRMPKDLELELKRVKVAADIVEQVDKIAAILKKMAEAKPVELKVYVEKGKPEPKQRIQWFNSLPPIIRQQALTNYQSTINPDDYLKKYDTLKECLEASFNFLYAPEGKDYWLAVVNFYSAV
jgi:hypothetical protein